MYNTLYCYIIHYVYLTKFIEIQLICKKYHYIFQCIKMDNTTSRVLRPRSTIVDYKPKSQYYQFVETMPPRRRSRSLGASRRSSVNDRQPPQQAAAGRRNYRSKSVDNRARQPISTCSSIQQRGPSAPVFESDSNRLKIMSTILSDKLLDLHRQIEKNQLIADMAKKDLDIQKSIGFLVSDNKNQIKRIHGLKQKLETVLKDIGEIFNIFFCIK